MNKFEYYFRDVSRFKHIDVYRVHELFGVTDPALHHASKKILMAGNRKGGKGKLQDILEARAAIDRWLEMQTDADQITVLDKPKKFD